MAVLPVNCALRAFAPKRRKLQRLNMANKKPHLYRPESAAVNGADGITALPPTRKSVATGRFRPAARG
jgi:hypothetical protein